MNLNTWIEEKFKATNYTLEKTDKGISNHNYLLTINDNKYMVRVPKKNHESLGLQHEHEKEILPLVSDLDVPVIFFDEKTGIKVTNYIEDVDTFDECKDKDKFARCANLMKSLHTKKAPLFIFNPFGKIEFYKSQINNIHYIDQRDQFYQAYFDGDIDPMIDVQVQAFERMEDILWGYWANMLYEQRGEQIYFDIAKDKEKHYRG